jgi:hypothetical protein
VTGVLHPKSWLVFHGKSWTKILGEVLDKVLGKVLGWILDTFPSHSLVPMSFLTRSSEAPKWWAPLKSLPYLLPSKPSSSFPLLQVLLLNGHGEVLGFAFLQPQLRLAPWFCIHFPCVQKVCLYNYAWNALVWGCHLSQKNPLWCTMSHILQLHPNWHPRTHHFTNIQEINGNMAIEFQLSQRRMHAITQTLGTSLLQLYKCLSTKK